jgi:tetratricopeptide (TPR) repeat protein
MTITILLSVLLAASVEATVRSEIAPIPRVAPAEQIARADELSNSGRYSEARYLLEGLSVRYEGDAEVLWRLGKSYVDLGEVDPEEERKWFGLGVRTLRAAVAADSMSGAAVFNLAIAVGRDGLVRGNREKAEASREVKMLAERALEIDPQNDGAYHLLGRWHREVESLGFFTRAVVRAVYGGLPDASYEEALASFQKAYELSPRMAHLLEIGICKDLLGRELEARSIYERVIAMESDHADAPLMREEARRRLAE